MILFPDRDRTNTSPRANGEAQHEFYDRIAGQFWHEIRSLLEDWFSRVDQADRLDLGSRLRSDDDRQFDGAFHELYLHESLLRMGYSLTIHPPLPNSEKHVDFLAEKDGESFYLEAGSARPSDFANASSTRVSQVYDFLNRMDCSNFRFAVKVVRQTIETPRPGPLRQCVRDWIQTLNPDDCMLSNEMRLADLPHMPYDDKNSGWRLELTAIGRPPQQRGDSTIRNVWMSEDGEHWADEGGIANTLKKKGRKYGDLDAPFVVAVSTGSMGVTDEDGAALLYGNGHWERDEASDETRLVKREPNGYWGSGHNYKHRHVSAVLIVPLLRPATLPRLQHTIWKHPDPAFPVDDLPMWRSAIHREGMPAFTEPTRTQADWFGLDQNWPTGNPYP